ncbi:hypothetical protein OG896_24935 [Streptomyces sp. NBC_00669]|uniref:hypothetical protein n=1 Tax=Streptomyces sp. NBC_00669 TaxID=2976011 RepID=UPI002E3368DD|nr:hypothetical protein [Streptomyces sp. NBC_00669]
MRLESAAAVVEAALSAAQRRDLFEAPGSTVVAIVELTSTSYTGHAEDIDKDPQVKVRVSGCEVARTRDEETALREARRAMYRAREVHGTLDSIEGGPDPAGAILSQAFVAYPDEAEFRRQAEEKGARARATERAEHLR